MELTAPLGIKRNEFVQRIVILKETNYLVPISNFHLRWLAESADADVKQEMKTKERREEKKTGDIRTVQE